MRMLKIPSGCSGNADEILLEYAFRDEEMILVSEEKAENLQFLLTAV